MTSTFTCMCTVPVEHQYDQLNAVVNTREAHASYHRHEKANDKCGSPSNAVKSPFQPAVVESEIHADV